MRAADREAVRRRERFRCGYCGVHEEDVGSRLTVDHFRPRIEGGTDDQTNLVYCYSACNSFKGDHWAETSTAERILHPHFDDISIHVMLDSTYALVGLIDTGRFNIRRLQLNRPELIANRQKRAKLAELDQQLQDQEREMAQLANRARGLVIDVETLTARLHDITREGFR